MAEPRQRNPIGPVGDHVRANVRQLRTDRNLSTNALAQLLSDLGRPLQPSAITKIESGDRSVDVGDLTALAIALGVSPVRLLLPADDTGGPVHLTPAISATAPAAWSWALCDRVLWPALVALGRADRPLPESQDDFLRHTLPAGRRLDANQTAARAAADVLESVNVVLQDRHPRADHPVNPEALSATENLRLALNRLIAEVAALTATPNLRTPSAPPTTKS